MPRLPNCNPDKSRLCPGGKACVPLTKNCRTPVGSRASGPAGATKTRKDPTCTPGRTKKCGKACIPIARTCHKEPVIGGVIGGEAPNKKRRSGGGGRRKWKIPTDAYDNIPHDQIQMFHEWYTLAANASNARERKKILDGIDTAKARLETGGDAEYGLL